MAGDLTIRISKLPTGLQKRHEGRLKELKKAKTPKEKEAIMARGRKDLSASS